MQDVKLLLNLQELEKLRAIVNGILLSVLIVLYAFLMKDVTPRVTAILVGVLITIILQIIITLLWTRKTEKHFLESGDKFWNIRHITGLLGISVACALAGIVAIAALPNPDIAMIMIIVLSVYLGTNLGRLVKIACRYKKA